MNEVDLASLAHLSVVVTRPREQAGPLSAALTAVGARVVRLPCIQIEPLSGSERASAQAGGFDAVVCVSVNAVVHAGVWLKSPSVRPDTWLVAVGQATGEAMRAAGLSPDWPAHANSEGILAMARWDTLPANARVLIVRGAGGRETLADGLRSRGFDVRYAQVYKRVRPALPDAGAGFRTAMSEVAPGTGVVLLSSVEILRNFRALVGEDNWGWACGRLRFAAVSQRIVDALVADAGDALHYAPWCLAGAGVQDTIESLQQHWRETAPED